MRLISETHFSESNSVAAWADASSESKPDLVLILESPRC